MCNCSYTQDPHSEIEEHYYPHSLVFTELTQFMPIGSSLLVMILELYMNQHLKHPKISVNLSTVMSTICQMRKEAQGGQKCDEVSQESSLETTRSCGGLEIVSRNTR